MVSGDCIFCAIAAKRAPVRMVHETAELLCFFPRQPNLLAHTLIVPREHHADLRDCPPSLGNAVFEVTQRLAQHYAAILGSTGFNLMNASGIDAEQSVQHLHFHFLPRFPDDPFSTWPTLPPFEADLDTLLDRLRF
jgi:histidine triad (HIT) family protein